MNMSIGLVNRALSCAFFGLVVCASPGFAQRAPNREPRTAPNRAPQHAANRQPRFAPNRYIVFLQDEAVAARFTKREEFQTAAAMAYRQQLEARQQSVIEDLAGRHIQVAGSVSTLMNAIFVVATPDRLAELQTVPGVIGVMPERRIKPSLNAATTLAKAPAAWAQSAIGGQANAGKGIKIGILDTGIDQTHPAFSDTGFTAPAGFPKCNVPTDCTNFTNNKVIVARSYVPMIAKGSNPANLAADSIPDDFSARDRDGHGTAIAAAAAAVQTTGVAVAATGVAVAFSGMAPKAYLGSYKISGSDGVSGAGSESVIIQALNDAVTDGMDIVNLSNGVPAFAGWQDDVQCGNAAGVRCDPLAYAFEKAAQAGLVITAPVGNSGSDGYWDYGENDLFTANGISSPATAPSVISVGATVSSHVLNPTVTVNASGASTGLKNIAAALSDSYFYPSYVGANTAPLVDVAQLATVTDGYACSPLPAGTLTDKFALIQDGGTCSGNFDQKVIDAHAAGAVGVVFYMSSSAAITNPEGICYYTSTDIFPVCDLYGPAVMISLSAGQALKTYVDANPGASVTIDTAGSEQVLSAGAANTYATFSSLGPTPDGLIKPDLVATGGFDYWDMPDPQNDPYLLPAANGLYTAGQNYDPNGSLFSANRYVAVSGTSMAAALVAGAAALVKQAHPTWTAAQIKSALVNNSAQDVTQDVFGDQVDVEWIGAGRLDANAAVAAPVTAQPPTLSLGYLKSGTAFPKPVTVTLTNSGGTGVTLTAAVVPGTLTTTTSATVTVSSKSLTVAGNGGTASFTVTLAGTVPVGGEYSGAVTLTSASPAVSLTIPYMFLVGDGSSPNVIPLYGDVYYGSVGQDLGPIPIQVIDQWGVPVAGSSVTFTVSPRGAATLKPVAGTPGSTAANTLPFVPSTCTPSTSTTSVTCTTNSNGVAWVELVGGASPYDLNAGTATVNVAAAGTTILIFFGLVPQPNLTSVQDAAAGGTTIAPGSYVSLYGTNLVDPDNLPANATFDQADATNASGRLPLTLDGVTVSFDAPAAGGLAAISVPGYVYAVSAGQVNIYAPWELENYPSAQMKVSLSGFVRTNVLTVPLANYVPAFLWNGPGSGGLLFADARDNNTGALITTSSPATAGEVLQLYCNGLGPVTNRPVPLYSGDPAPGSPNLAQTTTPVTVSIGGKNAPVAFAGLTPGFVGLYLVDVTVPSGLTPGNQPITVSVAGKTSPVSVISGSTTFNFVLPVK